jgi:hypothetical protein
MLRRGTSVRPVPQQHWTQHSARLPLAKLTFLDRLQIDHDGADILAAKSEFGHVWMARDDALAQSFLQGLDRIALGKSAKQRSLPMPALTGAAGSMATRAISCEKSLAAAEGGHVVGSSSGYNEGKADTQ